MTCDWGWCGHPAAGWRQQMITVIGHPPHGHWLPVCRCHHPAELILAA